MCGFGVEKAVPAVLSALQLLEVLVKLLVDWELLEKLPDGFDECGTASGEEGEELLEVYLVLRE